MKFVGHYATGGRGTFHDRVVLIEAPDVAIARQRFLKSLHLSPKELGEKTWDDAWFAITSGEDLITLEVIGREHNGLTVLIDEEYNT